MLIEKNFTYFFNSSTASGALNKSVDGSRFTVQLYSPIGFSQSTKYVSVSVIQADVWNNGFNISTARANNVWSFEQFDGATTNVFSSNIPDGQYTVYALQAFITLQLINVGFVGDEITITGDSSTSKIILYVKENFLVNFTIPNSVRGILGFNSQLVPPVFNAVSPTYQYADETA